MNCLTIKKATKFKLRHILQRVDSIAIILN